MTSTPKPPTPPNHTKEVVKVVKKITKVLGICFGLAVLAALGYALVTIDLWHVHFGYQKAVARYKAAGMPWTAADLAGPEIPPEKDAGPRLFALAETIAELKPALLPSSRPDFLPLKASKELDGYFRELEANLASRNKHLDEYKALAPLEIHWDKDMDEGGKLLYPEFSWLMKMSKAFAARMELRSYRGDIKGSLEDFRLGARLSQHTGESNVLNGKMVETAQRSTLLLSYRRAASYHLDEPAVLDAYAEAAKELEPSLDFVKAIRSDAYMGLTTLRNVSWSDLLNAALRESWYEDLANNSKKLIRDGDPPSFVNRSYAVPFLDYWADYGEGVQAKGESLFILSELGKELNAKRQAESGVSSMFMAVFTTDLASISESGKRTLADRSSTLAALKVAALKARKGSITQKEIDALLPEDPFSRQPMKASVKGSVIKVWSVGEDEIDNSGVTRSEANGGPFDYVSELPFRATSPTNRPPGIPPVLPGQSGPPSGGPPSPAKAGVKGT